jgi:hypothetical protein
MANVKISDLTAYTDAASTDILPIVDIGNDVTKKITIGDVVKAVPLGTAALPGLAFDGDPNSGVYSPGADQVAISTNGSHRVRVDSTGNVGLKTTSPNVSLEIARLGSVWAGVAPAAGTALFVHSGGGTTTSANIVQISAGTAGLAGLYFGDDDSPTSGQIGYDNTLDSLRFNTNGAERMRLDSTGRLGLGTSSPAALLHLSSGANTTMRLADTAGSYSDIIYNESGAVSQLILDADPTGSSAATGGTSILLKTDGTTAMTIDSSQRVGIGTTLPATNLHIRATGTPILRIQDDDGAVQYSDFYNSSGQSIYNAVNGAGGRGPHIFLQAGNEAARIDSSGRLLVGTSTAFATRLSSTATTPGFQVRESGSGSALFFNGVNSANPATLYSVKSRGTTYGTIVQNNDSLFRISAAGDDGVQATEAARIDVAVDGTPGANDMPGRIVLSTTADGASSPTERLRITSAGVLQVADAGNITVGTTTGTKIGTATTQKLGFYNATPVVQPTAVADATTAVDVITQLNDLLAKLRTLGIIAT